MKRKKWGRWVPLALWVALAVFLACQDGGETARASRSIARLLVKLLMRFGIAGSFKPFHMAVRKFAHVLVHAVLGFLLWNAAYGTFDGPRQRRFTGIVACVALCLADEAVKLWIPGRHCQWDEALLNCAAGLAGMALCRVTLCRRRGRAE